MNLKYEPASEPLHISGRVLALPDAALDLMGGNRQSVRRQLMVVAQHLRARPLT